MAKAESVDLKLLGFFGAKGTPDSEAGKGPTWSPTWSPTSSPTSPLDFGVFANFGGFFSPRSPAPSSPRFNKWVCDKVGLSLLTCITGDGEENIVLAPQIKLNVSSARAEPSSKSFAPCVQSDPLPNNIDSPSRSTSSPMDIVSSHTQVYSREMALSEDYTCIISHGPNPKTTHIFGDCILDCDPKELRAEGDDDSFSRQDCHNTPPHIHSSDGKETEKTGVEDSLGSSSDNEDVFPMAMPLLNP
ncbi:unnamed protein product [Microthlaspi erraticum]|uniref:FLZ-type domain-containing protein n=1 Tax=Microthlaspi erraticum TaxID=1685480 RepID=A0A6D2IKZ1_9BRAS|nr:unnamed protein product [Microthlaspi erraticum]